MRGARLLRRILIDYHWSGSKISYRVNRWKSDIKKLDQIISNFDPIFFLWIRSNSHGIWYLFGSQISPSDLIYSCPCQIAPLYRPEKRGQFGDSVQFCVVQFSRAYCIWSKTREFPSLKLFPGNSWGARNSRGKSNIPRAYSRGMGMRSRGMGILAFRTSLVY